MCGRSLRYRHTTSKPVSDGAGNQAVAQLYPRDARCTGILPPAAAAAPPSLAQPPTPAAPGQLDADHDGTETDAIFVSPQGDDANPGTKAKPKRTVQAAVETVADGNGEYVLVAASEYGEVDLGKKNSGVGIYGGYSAKTWARGTGSGLLTAIDGSPQAVLADGATDVVLRLLTVDGSPPKTFGASGYGIRALNGSKLVLRRVTVVSAGGEKGSDGVGGVSGANGQAGLEGRPGDCDDGSFTPLGGHGGFSPAGRRGGRGGDGGHTNPVGGASTGASGYAGEIGTPGGSGGQIGDPAEPGDKGRAGANGAAGATGAGGSAATVLAGAAWVGRPGTVGRAGQPGNGGGGGGGGGQQDNALGFEDGAGNGGGGGGGAAAGTPGTGGGPGGGLFGVYLYSSSADLESSKIGLGDGGEGGDGGHGGAGGTGGAGGSGGAICTSEVGRGGDGGHGGNGGRGGYGGGAGGPSIGIFKSGRSSATCTTRRSTTAGPARAAAGSSPEPSSNGATGIAADVYPG